MSRSTRGGVTSRASPSRLLQSATGAADLIAWIESIGAGLRISPTVPAALVHAVVPPGREASEEAAWLEREGFAVLSRPGTGDAERALREALTGAVARLVEQGLPAAFVFLFDEVWILGTQLVAALSTMLRRSYVLAADGYAWQVAVGTGRGWRPHRDEPRLLDRVAPESVNLWFAITDATTDRACIHVIPLDEDPGYPYDLSRSDAPLNAVRALPAAAGTALTWNGNVLHWGGACSARAHAARVAIAFTALRADAAGRIGPRRLSPEMLSPPGRLDVVASLIARYEPYRGPDVSDEVMTWAKARCGLARCARRLAHEADAVEHDAAAEHDRGPSDPTAPG
jgi:hypothetical protein